MTSRARSRRSFGRGSRRQKTTWHQVTAGFTMVAAAAVSTLDLTPPLITAAGNSGGTIKRSIGNIAVETSGALNDHIDLDVGILVSTTAGFVGGSVPNPATAFSQDWYYWFHKDSHLPGNTAEAMNQLEVEWDIHTMRRLREGYRLLIVVQKSVTNAVINVSFGMRNLWTMQA